MWDKRHQLLVSFGYNGHRFRGLQPQPGVLTAGGALRERLTAAGALPKGLAFTARTDAGVHARQNLATCWLKNEPQPERVEADVMRPRDDGLHHVRVIHVDKHVHARTVGFGKHYRYEIAMGCSPEEAEGGGPLDEPCWRIAPWLDAEAMTRAASLLVGEHDYRSFCYRPDPAQSTVRAVQSIDIDTPSPARLVIDVRGTSFLRQMVRILVGTLVEVGAGLRPAEQIPEIFAAKWRRAAGISAPAHGLTLMQIALPEALSARLAATPASTEAAPGTPPDT